MVNFSSQYKDHSISHGKYLLSISLSRGGLEGGNNMTQNKKGQTKYVRKHMTHTCEC